MSMNSFYAVFLPQIIGMFLLIFIVALVSYFYHRAKRIRERFDGRGSGKGCGRKDGQEP
jgi:hypothetical protein